MRRDDGSMSLFFAIGLVALLVIAGLVLDGGAQLRATQRAQGLAEEAARAGAQSVDVDALMQGQSTRLDPAQARSTAQSYLTAAGATGTVSAGTDTVTVDVTISTPTLFLTLIGVSDLTGSGSATARLALSQDIP